MQGLKRESTRYDEENESKRSRGSENTVTLRFLVCSQHAGGIIGRGGTTIKRLRSDYSAQVTLPDADGPERVLSIRADREDLMDLLRECLPLMMEPPYSGAEGKKNDYENDLQEVNFLVHQSQAGGIIGRGGERIKDLRETTNAKVKVFQECIVDTTERIVAIAGDDEAIIGCIQGILDILKDTTIRGDCVLYDPTELDYEEEDNFGGNFGGFQQQGGFGGNMCGGQNFQQPGGNFGGNFGGAGGNMGGNQGFGQQQSQQGFQQNAGGGSGGSMNTGEARESTQVTIPEDKAGCIIGKGGDRIRNIRVKSGADIRIGEPSPRGGDRLITIHGTHVQIQHAQYLMQQSVKQFSGQT